MVPILTALTVGFPAMVVSELLAILLEPPNPPKTIITPPKLSTLVVEVSGNWLADFMLPSTTLSPPGCRLVIFPDAVIVSVSELTTRSDAVTERVVTFSGLMLLPITGEEPPA